MIVTFTVGPPASGKSTWAKKYCNENPTTIRVNRDDIRDMSGKYWIPSREEYITEVEHAAVMSALKLGYNVIVDSTNLNTKLVYYLIQKIERKHNVNIVFKVFDVELEELIRRDSLRDRPVGEAVIRRMYNKFKKEWKKKN